MGTHEIAEPAPGAMRFGIARISERTLLLAMLATFTAIFVFNLVGTITFIHDDAYIGFRYVKTLVETGDFSWNPGDRVEGYTNFLDLILVAGLVKLGVDPLSAARGLHAVALIAMFGLVVWRVGTLVPPARRLRAQVFAAAALMLSSALPMWLWGGLETLLAAALVTGGVAVLAPLFRNASTTWRTPAGAGLLFALAVLTRPDNVMAGVAAGAALLFLAPMPLRARALSLAAFSAAPILVVGSHEAFRIIYYGDWLPNTFWAKTGTPFAISLDHAWQYILRSSVCIMAMAIFLVFRSIGKPSETERTDRVLWFAACVVAMQFVYTLLIGGDHMPAGRFFVPAMGAAAIGIGLIAAHAAASRAVALAAALLVAGLLNVLQVLGDWRPIDLAAMAGREMGIKIDGAWPKGSVIALHTAGSTPWFAPDHTYIDMLGLNDRAIARHKPPEEDVRGVTFSLPGHLRGNAGYVLSREPDYIIVGPALGTYLDRPWFVTDIQLAKSGEFLRCYAMRTWPLPDSIKPVPGAINETVFFERTCAKTSRR